MSEAYAAQTGIWAVIVAVVTLSLGYIAVDLLDRRRELDPIYKAALSLPVVVAFALLVMLLHIATGGRVLSQPALVRGLVAAAAAILVVLKIVRRKRGVPAGRADLTALAAMLLLALVVWGNPVFRMPTLDYTGDTVIHTGWTNQLMNGESTPSAPLTGEIPNYYPWLFHGLSALLAWFTRMPRPHDAMGPLHLLLISGMVMALFALGRQITGRWTGGAAAALFGGLAGGFGFFLLSRPDLVMQWNPTPEDAMTYLGDLLFNRSYNVAFSNMPPPFPRDIAFALLPAFLLMLAQGLARGRASWLLAAGVTLGLIGLSGAEGFLAGLAVAALAALTSKRLGRFRTGALLLLPAIALWLLWAGPLFFNYFRLGGFRSLAANLVSLTPLAFVVTWGITLPFALYGAWTLRLKSRERTPATRVCLWLLVSVGGAILFSSAVSGLLGGGVETLGRQHRYWPLFHLALALVAAVGAADVLQRLGRRSRGLAALTATIAVALALPSSAIASSLLPSEIPDNPELVRALEGDPRSWRNVFHRGPGRQCVAAVARHREGAAFSYTGYRLVVLQWSPTDYGHIRWAGIFKKITPVRERLADNHVLTTGSGGPGRVAQVIRKYGVDVIMVEPGKARLDSFASYDLQPTRRRGPIVVNTGPCSR